MPPAKAANADMGWIIAGAQHVRLADSKGKVVILDFYATWCVPCEASIPHLVRLHKRYAAKGLQIVGLNVGGPGDYDKVPLFARKFGIPYQLGIPDPELAVACLSDDSSIPQTFLFDRNGTLVKRFIGYDDSLPEELESLTRSLLEASN
jgi:thiol-disulfide isomerase/thioredoxin